MCKIGINFLWEIWGFVYGKLCLFVYFMYEIIFGVSGLVVSVLFLRGVFIN